jgi:serine/threonine protein kinase
MLIKQHMHQHHIILGATRPSVFGVIPRPHRPPLVDICRYQDPFGLSNFNLAGQIAGTSLEHSPLFASDQIDSANRLQDDRIKKTLRYLAPEVVGTRQLTVWSDIFALGVIMYEILTGTTIDGGPDSPDITSVDILQDFQRHMLLEIPPPHVYLEREAAVGAYEVELPPTQLSEIVMKCLAKDTDERYSTIDALKYDLGRLGQVIRARGDLSKLQIGEVDRISRYKVPKVLIGRQEQVKELDKALSECSALADSETWSTKVMTVYGLSGSGKTRLLQEWSQKLESQGLGKTYMISYAKEDEHISRPLSSFTQIFDSLLERVLADAKEDADDWRKRIYSILGGHLDLFIKLLSPSSQRLLAPDRREKKPESIDWSNFIPAFKTWSQRLLQLFATESRPLVLIIDDCQWLETSEVGLWRHFLESRHALNHILVACAYRVEELVPPPAPMLLSSSSTHLMVDRLPEEGILNLLQVCFHDRLDKASSLVSFLHAETTGSPLYLRSLLNTLVSRNALDPYTDPIGQRPHRLFRLFHAVVALRPAGFAKSFD